MPALSFQKRFCPAVEIGEKTHSIRSQRKRRWKAGDRIALYYAMRTKQCRLLGRTRVAAVEQILLTHDPLFRIRIEGVLLSPDEARSFARRDGFPDLSDMADFWMEKYAIHVAGSWQGEIIHWRFPFEEPEAGMAKPSEEYA
jgi:uncharacterized protein YqfB (UPF0267 family)